MKSKRATFVGTVAVVAIVSGAAWAAIPDSGGVFHGCYHNQSGAMRIVDTDTGQPKGCGQNETEVSWNRQGPKGDTGPMGPAGPAGPIGPAGTSMGFGISSERLVHLRGGAIETILSKTVPAGNYVLFAGVSARNGNFGDFGRSAADGRCSIPGHEQARIIMNAEINATLTLTSAISHPGGPIELRCTERNGDLWIDGASLSGIKVDSLG